MGCIGSIICPPHKQEDKGTGQSMYKQLRLLHEQIYSKAQTAEIHPQPRSQSKQVKPANKKPYNQHQRFQQHTHANRSNPVPKENYEVTERNPRKSREHRKYSSRKKTYQRPKIQGPGQSPYGGCDGQWVKSKYIQTYGRAFGYFSCFKCNNCWMSVHSKKWLRQGCKFCKEYYLPNYLWRSDFNDQEMTRIIRTKKHLTELCQACEFKQCSFVVQDYENSKEQTVSLYED